MTLTGQSESPGFIDCFDCADFNDCAGSLRHRCLKASLFGADNAAPSWRPIEERAETSCGAASMRTERSGNDPRQSHRPSVTRQIFSDSQAFCDQERRSAVKQRPVSNTTIAAQFLDLSIESWSPFDRLPTMLRLRGRLSLIHLATQSVTAYRNAIVSARYRPENSARESP